MYLDDVQFDEKRSALKTFKEDGERFWFHAYGKNYAPGTLELGQHSFRVEYDSIYFQGTDGLITFTVVEC